MFEVPDVDCFKAYVHLADLFFVLEDMDTGEMAGWGEISECSRFCRSPEAKCCETTLILSEKYRGKYLGSELIPLFAGLAKQFGFRMQVNDTFGTNTAGLKARRRIQDLQVGDHPKRGLRASIRLARPDLILVEFR